MLTKESLFNIYQEAINNIEEAYEQNALSVDEASSLKQNAVNEFNAYLSELENVEFSEYDDVAEFNALGTALLEVGEAAGYEFEDDEDIENYIYDLSETLGVEPEECFQILTDEDIDDETSYAVLDELGLIEDEYEDDELEDEYEDELEEEDYEDPELEEANYRIAELENQMAEFQAQSEVLSLINQQENRALEMVGNGELPPIIYQTMFQVNGQDIEDNDKVAAFSALAEANNTNIVEELRSNEKVLKAFEILGQNYNALFSNIVEDDISEFEADEDSALESRVKAGIEYRKKVELGLV